MHCLLWAGAIAGTVSPINPFLSIDQIVAIMRASGSGVLVVPSPAKDRLLFEKGKAIQRVHGAIRALVVTGANDADGSIGLEGCARFPPGPAGLFARHRA